MTRPLDLAIVGGGPVGLATAVFAATAGLEVAVLDQRQPPIDKACGEGLMPDAVELLAEMGITPALPEAVAFRGIRYVDGERVAEARFDAGHGLGIRRPALHRALVGRAEELGAELRWRTRVTGLSAQGLETSAGPVAARWIVGADGLSSRMRRWAGLEGRAGNRLRFGRRRHYALEPWTDLVEVHWTAGHEAYVTPVGPGEVGVAMLWNAAGACDPAPGFDRLLTDFPALGERLAGAEITSRDRGSGPLCRLARGVRRQRVLLVGDAAGYLDAITGEGLALGFQQAKALVDAVATHNVDAYPRAVRRLTATPFRLIRLLLIAERRPWLRRRVVAALAADPELFARLLRIHARQAEPRDLGVGGMARLIRGLLAAA